MRERVSVLTRTLFANGVLLHQATPVGSALLLTCDRPDRFGCRLRYLFALVDGDLSAEQAAQLESYSAGEQARLVAICDGSSPASRGFPVFSGSDFLERFGGEVSTLLPLEASFPSRLEQLGQMQLPTGMTGEPETIFETYVGASLQFVLGTIAVQYGAKRSGEKVPDGLIALPSGGFILYDAKSSSKGYSADASEMRKFEDYVTDFRSRYTALGSPFAFVVVSAAFDTSDHVLAQRSSELYASAKVPAAFMTTGALSAAISALKDRPELRRSVRWESVFSQPQVTGSVIAKAINASTRDKVETFDA